MNEYSIFLSIHAAKLVVFYLHRLIVEEVQGTVAHKLKQLKVVLDLNDEGNQEFGSLIITSLLWLN